MALAVLVLLAARAAAQDPPSPSKTAAVDRDPATDPSPDPRVDVRLDDLSTARRRALWTVPAAVTVVPLGQIRARGAMVAIDALHERPGLWVAHDNGLNGQLIMRGLAGHNVLVRVDGQSLSTLWGEGGARGDDLFGKIDPDSLERIEVIRGPAAFLHGSGAVGGMVHFVSREVPFDFAADTMRMAGAQRLRMSSVDHGWR